MNDFPQHHHMPGIAPSTSAPLFHWNEVSNKDSSLEKGCSVPAWGPPYSLAYLHLSVWPEGAPKVWVLVCWEWDFSFRYGPKALGPWLGWELREETCFHFFYLTPGSWIAAESCGKCFLICVPTAILSGCTILYSHQQPAVYEGSSWFTSLPTMMPFWLRSLMDVKWFCGFDLFSPDS